MLSLTVCMFTAFGLECKAQQSIEKLVNSLEKKEDICHLQNIVKRDPRTHNIVKTVKKLTIVHADNTTFTKLYNAFRKESENANEVYSSNSFNSTSNTLVFYGKKSRKFIQMNSQGSTIELILINKNNTDSQPKEQNRQQQLQPDFPFFNINFDFFSR